MIELKADCRLQPWNTVLGCKLNGSFLCEILKLHNLLLVMEVLQPLGWRCIECAIHYERNVREEQHRKICGANKQ